MILKEFRCAAHGDFEASHPICPHMGCESEHVERVFLTPVGLRSDRTKATDSTLDGIARDYRLSDMNNRGGRAVLEGDPSAAIWGGQGVANMDGMMKQASTPTVMRGADGREHVADNMGMRAAARAFDVDGKRSRRGPLPPAETTVVKSDREDRAKLGR